MNGWKQLAGVLASIGLLVGAWFALTPVSVDAPHADGRCGRPAIRLAAQQRVDDPNEQAIIDRCEAVSRERVSLAGVAVATGFTAAVMARLLGRRRAYDAYLRRLDTARRREAARAEAEQRAAEEAARAEAEALAAAAAEAEQADRDAALRG